MLFQRFLDDRSASVVPLLALAAIPVTGLIGAAVDYSRAAAIQASLQAAADSTSLAMAKTASTLSTAQLQTNGTAYFNALFTRTDAATPTVTVSYPPTAARKLWSVPPAPSTRWSWGSWASGTCRLPLRQPRPGATTGCGSRSCSTIPAR